MSSAGLPSKKPTGLRWKPVKAHGITGQSSGRTTWWAPTVYQSTMVGPKSFTHGRAQCRGG